METVGQLIDLLSNHDRNLPVCLLNVSDEDPMTATSDIVGVHIEQLEVAHTEEVKTVVTIQYFGAKPE